MIRIDTSIFFVFGILVTWLLLSIISHWQDMKRDKRKREWEKMVGKKKTP